MNKNESADLILKLYNEYIVMQAQPAKASFFFQLSPWNIFTT